LIIACAAIATGLAATVTALAKGPATRRFTVAEVQKAFSTEHIPLETRSAAAGPGYRIVMLGHDRLSVAVYSNPHGAKRSQWFGVPLERSKDLVLARANVMIVLLSDTNGDARLAGRVRAAFARLK
jgi:hypothetical protein